MDNFSEPRRVALGPMVAEFRQDPATGMVGWRLLPAEGPALAAPRPELSGVAVTGLAAATNRKFPARRIESLIQIRCQGDDCGTTQGRSLRNGGTVAHLVFQAQAVRRDEQGVHVRTTFVHDTDGWRVHHDLRWQAGASFVESRCAFEHTGAAPVALELLASFSLSDITPYAEDDAPGRLRLHRCRSAWSNEGRLDTALLEDLNLERSWTGYGARCERFGVVGSMPVNGYFPFVALEDTHAGVTWAAQLDAPGSWQMEIYRRDDDVSLSGGLPDREFGHWFKRCEPGSTFTTPTAFLTAVTGGVDDACHALLAAQEAHFPAVPAAEETLPVIFNEWSTSWGRPDHAGMVALAGKLAGTGIRYLVMDAGWFLPETGTWGSAHGDWIPSKTLYPHGLRATAEAIRAKGLIPGLWFEMETCGPDSVLYQRTEWMLRRDGTPIAAGGRRFLDFRRPEVVDYLAGKVIATLRDNHFGYLKVDYNATLGIGVDGGDSPGAALQDHLGGVGAFFERIRRELPDLVIENCSSGGHRLTPYFFARSAMSSFSDAHECPEIPLIAADLHRLMLPRQCQIWAVLRAGEPLRRTLYLITGGFLGRLCFSGDFTRLSPEQEEWVRRAVRFYERVAPLIREGRTRRLGPTVRVRNHAEGWQAVQRIPPNDTQRLVVAHTFGGAVPDVLDIALAAGPGWRIADGLWETPPEWLDDAGVLRWTNPGQWAGMAILLERA